MRCISALTAALGVVLGVTGLALVPLCFFEGWKGDGVITIMLATSIILFVASCSCLDRIDRQRTQRFREPE